MSSPAGKLFCFGFGYTSHYLASRLKDRGFAVAGCTRDPEKKAALRQAGIEAYTFERDRPLGDPLYILRDVTHLLLSVPPDDEGDPVYLAHMDELTKLPHLQWAGYLSSTVVYGDRAGGWVDENSELRPNNKRGSRRARAEEQWQSLQTEYNFPVHLFRLAGIYGPGRNALDSVRAGNARRIIKPGHAFSRAYIDDIVTVLETSIDNPSPGAVYNVADDLPTPSADVIAYACELLGMPVPPVIPFDQADVAPITQSFYSDNKRIHNDRIKNDLGVRLSYPTYREGLDACLKAEQAHAILPAWLQESAAGSLRE